MRPLRGDPVDAMQALRHGQTVISDGGLNWLAVSGIAINANALLPLSSVISWPNKAVRSR
jgi:hypothetical protein